MALKRILRLSTETLTDQYYGRIKEDIKIRLHAKKINGDSGIEIPDASLAKKAGIHVEKTTDSGYEIECIVEDASIVNI